MKKVSYLLLICFLITVNSFSQTAQLAKTYQQPGTNILYPVSAKKLTNLGAVGFYINYNKNVLKFLDIVDINSSLSSGNTFLYNNVDSIVKVGWFSNDAVIPANFPDSARLFNIKFQYIGGYSKVSFDTANSVIGDINGVNKNQLTKYQNGFVDQAINVNETSNASVNVNIYPDPTYGLFNVVTTHNKPIKSLKLVNVEGKEIINRTEVKQSMLTLDISKQPEGVYFLRVECEGSFFYRKVVKVQ